MTTKIHTDPTTSPTPFSPPALNKFRGCLIGGAVGDALGLTTENMSRRRIEAKFGRVTDYKVKPGWGYYTDDTQLTIALAENLLVKQGFERQDFRRRLVRWWLVPPRLGGRSTKNAAFKCLLGRNETGRNVPGSSGAMRAAPLALFYHDDPRLLRTQTVESCRVTHVHPSAIAGALVNTFSIRYALTQSVFNQTAYLAQVAEVAARYDPDLSRRLLDLPRLLDEPEAVALQALLPSSNLLGSPIGDIIATAVYAFIKWPDDYARSVLFCVNAGWDTDTMATIVGNISGAWNGLTGIPTRWVEQLENSYKGRDYILALADCLHDHHPLPQQRPAWRDYLADGWRNVHFLANLLWRKPMW